MAEEIDSTDRISELPDCLLFHILSFLYLDEALETCLLSKRWQFIWTGITKVNFKKFQNKDKIIYEIRKSSSLEGVGKMLPLCTNFKIFHLCWDILPSDDVNHWIQLAFRNKAHDLSLSICDESNQETFEIVDDFYSYPFVTKLSLNNLSLSPQQGIIWISLKELKLEDIKLSDSFMDILLIGCPVLECLRLQECTKLKNLNISSPNLTKLEIVGKIPNIRAPYSLFLKIDNWCEDGDRYFKIVNLSSIVEFNLYAHPSPKDFSTSSKSTRLHVKRILQSLKSVKKIDLGLEYLKVISFLEVKGWLFPSFVQLRFLKFTVLTREMSTLPGIIALLRSSPNLEALEICMIQHLKGISSDESLYNYDMDLVSSHLRTVKILLYNRRDDVNEYMLTLVSILLKSAPVLEEMTINIKVEASQHDPLAPAKIVERLLTLPRASSKVFISSKTSVVKGIAPRRQVPTRRNMIRTFVWNIFQTVIRWFVVRWVRGTWL